MGEMFPRCVLNALQALRRGWTSWNVCYGMQTLRKLVAVQFHSPVICC